MSVETAVVAVITQTLRIDACIDFTNAIGDESTITIFAGDPGAFQGAALPYGTSVMSASDPDLLFTDPVRLKRVGRRRLLVWMRSGSRIGRVSERAARKLLGFLRPVKDPSTQKPGGFANQPTNSYLVAELESLHAKRALSIIAVFDVFDLPSVLEFAALTGVRVIVR